jgi:carbon storage regulator CsrA
MMLILSAAEGERILIGDSIEIKVVGFGHCPKGKTARLGITAPREIPVDREVIREKIAQEGRRPRAH